MATNTVRTPAEVATAAIQAIAAGQLNVLDELGAPDLVVDFVAIGRFEGREAVKRILEELLAAFPDFEISVDRVVADHRAVAMQWRATGTFSGGSFQGVEPTGRRVELRVVEVMEIEEGRIRRNTIYYDGASLARQIGLLPAKGSLADRTLLRAFNARARTMRPLQR